MTLRVGLIGLGVVGAETARTLAKHASMIEARAGQPVVVAEVSARNRSKDRGVDLSGCRWRDDPLELATSPDVDLVCEVVGGEGGGRLAGGIGRSLGAGLLSVFVGQRLTGVMSAERAEDLRFLTGLIEAGAVTPVIGKSYALADAPAAIRDLRAGQLRGKAVITI